jgi:hypothetical protein
MASNQQKREQLAEKRRRQREREAAAARLAELEMLEKARRERFNVNRELLRRDGSYSTPEFVQRGYYVDYLFNCALCGCDQVWTATQQKWWYEVAKGKVWTIAKYCRNCRRKLREDKTPRKKRTGNSRAT